MCMWDKGRGNECTSQTSVTIARRLISDDNRIPNFSCGQYIRYSAPLILTRNPTYIQNTTIFEEMNQNQDQNVAEKKRGSTLWHHNTSEKVFLNVWIFSGAIWQCAFTRISFIDKIWQSEAFSLLGGGGRLGHNARRYCLATLLYRLFRLAQKKASTQFRFW